MKTSCIFIMALLCQLFFACPAQAQQLNKRISLKVTNASLPQILQKIQQQYAIRFSYLNNDLPVKNRISAEIKEKPLSDVLDVLLAKTNVGYLEKNGQVIIKKGLPKNLPKSSTLSKLPPATVSQPKTVKNPPSTEVKPEVPKKSPEPVGSSESIPVTEPLSAPVASRAVDSVSQNIPQANTQEVEKPALFDEDSTEIKPYHFGIIYPLSTHGKQANEYVNQFSAHLLVGTAAGLQGIEFAGLGNHERKYVRGFQFSGLFNIIDNPKKITSSADSINRYSLQGGQFAGLLNIAGGNSTGGQFAGLVNITQNSKGVQAAGLLNIAKQVNGAQLAGLLNKANYVSGSQVGFINISDSINGVPVGFLSIVKHGGYRHAELFAADDLNANFIFKIGVPKLHTLFALGAELDDKKRWGYGVGFGSEWGIYKRFHLNTDIISYYIIEDSYENFPDGLFEDYELNLLNKFRLLGTLQLAKHLALFGGPTFNVMVSKYQEPGAESVGSTLPEHYFYNHTSADGTNVKMWIGFNAGIRF